ncbi:MAG TPA: hypothetical protein VGC41_04555 [Kofleriaceae bacterium]
MLRLVAIALVTAACTGSIDGSGAVADDDDTAGLDAGVQPATGTDPVSRAQLWVDAQLPYCQAPNHAHDDDSDCASTCTRPDHADWDPYRSDCSGLVSWAWGLPAPGHTTATFAPFDTSVSRAIEASDLQPGDAINNDHHIMLFASWITVGEKARFLEEPACSSDQPYAREYVANVTLMGQDLYVQYRGTYTAIRQTR